MQIPRYRSKQRPSVCKNLATPVLFAGLTAFSLLVTGCATAHLDEFNAIEMGNASPAASPPAQEIEEGMVLAVDEPVVATIAIGENTVAFQQRSPSQLRIVSIRVDSLTEVAKVELPDSAGIAQLGADGAIAVPYDDGVVVIETDNFGAKSDPQPAQTHTIGGLGPTMAAVTLADGKVVTGSLEGAVGVYRRDGEKHSEISGMDSVAQLAALGSHPLGLDRRDTIISDLDIEVGRAGPQLRAGKAAGRIAVDGFGRALVTDTTGNALLVYTADPVRLHQAFPIPEAPWAVTYDQYHSIVWVTSTAKNLLLGYDLSEGTGVEVARIATVQQPDSVAVTADGTVVVGSAMKGEVHIVKAKIAGKAGASDRPTPSA